MRQGHKVGDKLRRLTQRLDHVVPCKDRTPEENQKIAAELGALSEKLRWLLPDPSLSPDERLERLARVVEGRTPEIENLRPGGKKLEKLKKRLDELVPEAGLTPEQKIDKLMDKLNDLVPEKSMSAVAKLEKLGDPRTEGKQ